MKADKKILIRAAELGIIRSLEDFLVEPLKPGRLKTRFEFVKMAVDGELAKIFKMDKNFFVDNKKDINVYLMTLADALHWKGGETHIGTVVSFCVAFLDRSISRYDPKLISWLTDILDYYERADKVEYRDIYKGKEFDVHWKIISDLMGEVQ